MNSIPYSETPGDAACPWLDLTLPGPSSLALGLFDGVHIGHREILRHAVESARRQNLIPAVFSFRNHPRTVLTTENGEPPRLLVTPERRIELIRECGVAKVLMSEFTRIWAETPSEVFAREVLADRLQARHVVVGFNYCFGRRAEGRARQLVEYGERWGFSVDVVPAFQLDGEEVSSTRVRNRLQEGNLIEAGRLLGRPHEISGEVIAGDGRGRTLGYPTANLATDLPPLLPNGVYAVKAYRLNSGGADSLGPGMFFAGPRRTFREEETQASLEVHLLDWSGSLYGDHLRLSILGRIRDAMTFSGVADLTRQLEKDRVACAPYFE